MKLYNAIIFIFMVHAFLNTPHADDDDKRLKVAPRVAIALPASLIQFVYKKDHTPVRETSYPFIVPLREFGGAQMAVDIMNEQLRRTAAAKRRKSEKEAAEKKRAAEEKKKEESRKKRFAEKVEAATKEGKPQEEAEAEATAEIDAEDAEAAKKDAKRIEKEAREQAEKEAKEKEALAKEKRLFPFFTYLSLLPEGYDFSKEIFPVYGDPEAALEGEEEALEAGVEESKGDEADEKCTPEEKSDHSLYEKICEEMPVKFMNMEGKPFIFGVTYRLKKEKRPTFPPKGAVAEAADKEEKDTPSRPSTPDEGGDEVAGDAAEDVVDLGESSSDGATEEEADEADTEARGGSDAAEARAEEEGTDVVAEMPPKEGPAEEEEDEEDEEPGGSPQYDYRVHSKANRLGRKKLIEARKEMQEIQATIKHEGLHTVRNLHAMLSFAHRYSGTHHSLRPLLKSVVEYVEAHNDWVARPILYGKGVESRDGEDLLIQLGAATNIQRVYRGHYGRKIAKKLAEEHESAEIRKGVSTITGS